MNTERLLRPQLLWGYFSKFVDKKVDKNNWNRRLSLYIFRKSETGAYYLLGPTLYWVEDPDGSGFFNCEQNELQKHSDDLAEVQGFVYRNSEQGILQWNSWEEFVEEMTGSNGDEEA